MTLNDIISESSDVETSSKSKKHMLEENEKKKIEGAKKGECDKSYEYMEKRERSSSSSESYRT
ncbi:hypothetical protein HEP_00452900, partial [Hepatocystis sp. ex Piliocolobus tephrosceles]